jgi:hypothetical protein
MDMTVLQPALTPPADASSVLATRDRLLDVAHELVREFDVDLPAGSVVRCVVRCRDELLRAGVREGLVEAVHAMARTRLRMRSGQLVLSG